jgi:inner membrane protein
MGRGTRILLMSSFAFLAWLPDIDMAWSSALHESLKVLPVTRHDFLSDPWGHRGLTHSIGFAVLAALPIAAAARISGQSAARFFLLAFLAVLSHPLLDMLCRASTGVLLAWPLPGFGDTLAKLPFIELNFQSRVQFAWRPLAAVSISSVEGHLLQYAKEAVYFLPCWIAAFWPLSAKERGGTPARS